jgi:hypothetical protein
VATISGGFENEASGGFSTVSGGYNSTASNDYATVSGGYESTASGPYATVPGGQWNAAEGSHSFAAGWGALAEFPGCFVWAGAGEGEFACQVENSFNVFASGGVYMCTDPGCGAGMYLEPGGSEWLPLPVARGLRSQDQTLESEKAALEARVAALEARLAALEARLADGGAAPNPWPGKLLLPGSGVLLAGLGVVWVARDRSGRRVPGGGR